MLLHTLWRSMELSVSLSLLLLYTRSLLLLLIRQLANFHWFNLNIEMQLLFVTTPTKIHSHKSQLLWCFNCDVVSISDVHKSKSHAKYSSISTPDLACCLWAMSCSLIYSFTNASCHPDHVHGAHQWTAHEGWSCSRYVCSLASFQVYPALWFALMETEE